MNKSISRNHHGRSFAACSIALAICDVGIIFSVEYQTYIKNERERGRCHSRMITVSLVYVDNTDMYLTRSVGGVETS